MNVITSIPKFADRHAYKHDLAPDGREALAHMLIIPEHGIAGFIYPSLRGGGTAKVRTTLFGPGLGEEIHEEIEGEAPDLDFDDWRFGPLEMAIVEPHHKVELRWKGERIQFDGTYEGAYPVYAFSSHPDGLPPYYGDDRTEQHGRVTGQLTVDGKTFEVNGWLVRDHSWGPRVWGLNQHYKWFHAVTAEASIHYFEMQSFGRRHLQGYLVKDGRMTHLVDAEYDYTFDENMMQQTFDSTVFDDEGRTARVECKAFANIRLDFDPITYLCEAPVTVTIDGVPGAGWCEFCWNKDYYNFARQHVAKYGQ
ncbi:DUF7064 domain-containing protein [Novosphingobium resinovorum]|uniref:Uncharacterized protein n=1 Tax=Novosphingobium resinovorum TaxID=158500 RepID=A0A1D8A9U3_9SPHN|nr:hypothetical protein [Novosphingobium resinovorum]AOR78882.1 hypothetical protein BES08_18390 [Novosphingobium resinovorum]